MKKIENMKKSINLYYNDKPAKEKLLEIKQTGFDEFFTSIDEERENFSLREQCEYALSLGLRCTMIHCLYYEPDLHYFWEEGEKGDMICDNYCKQIIKVKGLTKNFVIHLNADKNQKQSIVGLERIKRLLSVCEECKINLCIENLYSETEIPYIFKNIKHKKLKICFDVGHKNFLTPNFEVLKNYHEYVEVLHLHDNNGHSDEHLICGKGSINWGQFANELKLIPNIVLSSEAKCKDSNCDDFIREVYNGLVMIEKYIY